MTKKAIIQTNSKGYGYINENFDKKGGKKSFKEREEAKKARLVVLPEFLNHALNGDTVEYAVMHELTRFNEKQAQVKKVVERSREQYVGAIVKENDNVLFIADDKRVYVPFMLNKEDRENPKILNMKVVAKIKEWPKEKPAPLAEIIKVIGPRGEHEAEMQSIIIEKGAPEEFPEAVIENAHKIDKEMRVIGPEERALRRDFSLTPTFTIDPIDAKDFDDAISIKQLPNKNYEIGVHIADVSHYVRTGTALDEEALKRATSIYLVDRVIPMLPEILSNDLCSLNPKVERRTFSAVFEMNEKGEILNRWFGKSIINSHHRFTYENAQEVLDAVKKGDNSLPFTSELTTLNKIAYKLREEKYKNGAIDFDTDEVKFVLDGKGVPIKVVRKVRGDTHRLVEDFMLLANKEVARYLATHLEKKGLKGIYRVHDSPEKDRLSDLANLYKALGYEIPGNIIHPKDIKNLLAKITGTPEESLLKTATIRAMAKAIYATDNTGHFGLAFEYYTHFTSPIRRYPDLEVHRLLHAILTHDKKEEKTEEKRLSDIAEHSSEREIVAADAERTSIKYKQVEYMSSRIGQEFSGVITGVTEYGMFIEDKETKCEGMVRLRDMKDDIYSLEERLYRIVGSQTKKRYSLGDEVKFRVVSANLEMRTLDYALI